MKKKNMKNLTVRFAAMLLVVALCAALCSCGREAERVYDAGQFVLTEMTLDGEALTVASVYPQGAYLLLSSDGTGRLILGDKACDIPWQHTGGEFQMQINALAATGSAAGGKLTLELPDAGLELVFAEGQMPAAAPMEGDLQEMTPLQHSAAGDWQGRLWFELPQGEWADYTYRTLGLTASVTAGEDGTGEITLWNSFYSDIVPVAQISIEYLEAEQRIKCCGGWFMSYPVSEWGISISLQEEVSSEIEDTIIMHPDVYEYGHYYRSEAGADEAEAAEKTEPVLRLSGKCSDGKGSFEYRVVLRRGSEE